MLNNLLILNFVCCCYFMLCCAVCRMVSHGMRASCSAVCVTRRGPWASRAERPSRRSGSGLIARYVSDLHLALAIDIVSTCCAYINSSCSSGSDSGNVF